jgi:TusA-related sulfurtransferase
MYRPVRRGLYRSDLGGVKANFAATGVRCVTPARAFDGASPGVHRRPVSCSDDRAAIVPIVLDLRGVACPLAWAKAKVRLETLPRGTLVDVVIDDPRSLRDLPRAAEASGHQVVHVGEDGPPWRIRLDV